MCTESTYANGFKRATFVLQYAACALAQICAKQTANAAQCVTRLWAVYQSNVGSYFDKHNARCIEHALGFFGEIEQSNASCMIKDMGQAKAGTRYVMLVLRA